MNDPPVMNNSPAMNNPPPIGEIIIRTALRPGDIGYVIYMHGRLYKKEYDYGIAFEAYVASGLYEFYTQYDPGKDRVWICEHREQIVGFMLLIHRENNSAQLRYFILEPLYRGIGLGKKLMGLYVDFLKEAGFERSYLWTTEDLKTAAALYKRHGFRLVEEKASESFGRPLFEQKYELVCGGG
jgi:GNAT superfamily N-acetyltransferase